MSGSTSSAASQETSDSRADATLRSAERMLQEAVYRSRAKQAGAAGLAGADLTGDVGPGSCGLGARALVELEQTEEGRAAFRTLFPRGAPTEAADELAGLLSAWVERQDALDRKRNHFLRDFRSEHGYDRRQYDEDQRATFESGVEAVNKKENDERRLAARGIVALSIRTNQTT